MLAPVTTSTTAPARTQPDSVAARAVAVARDALLQEVPESEVGEHLGVEAEVEAERTVTHYFASTRPGYVGWRWAVTVVRAYRQSVVTVAEVVLIPGGEAIVAPDWVPYRERIRPGDMSPGDLLPVDDDDPRLVPAYSFGDDPLDQDEKAQIRDVARELYAGRVRVLSPEGRDIAAQRWYDGDGGPDAPIAVASPQPCHSCGFMIRLAGPLGSDFGVCANGDANDDRKVVALAHGCGAHSEVRLAKKHEPQPLPDHVLDTITVDELESF